MVWIITYKFRIHSYKLHGSPCKEKGRPRPFPQARKREASGGAFGTINSPKVTLKGCEKGPE